jgi:DNA-binding beta-propeller fold protein YncE
MPEVFRCLSCAAPLEFEGKQTQVCRFCGCTVIAPAHLFSTISAAKISDTTENLPVVAEIKQLLQRGNKIHAIKLFHGAFKTGLAEAKIAVERIERGESVILPTHIDASRTTQLPITIDKGDVGTAGRYRTTVVVIAAVGLFVIGSIIVGAIINSSSSNSENVVAAEVVEAAPVAVELLKIGGEGTGVGKFTDNRVVAVDKAGNIYSTDYNGGRIQVFDPAGNFIRQWSAENSDLTYAIAADRSGHLYVLGNKGVVKYSANDGTVKAKFEDHTLRDVETLPDGRVIAVGRKGIAIFDSDLALVKKFENAGADANSTFGFEKVTADASGTMYLLDRRSTDVIKFSPDGKFLNRMPIDLSSPNDLALDPAGNIYISTTSQIGVYSPTGRQIAAAPAKQAHGITSNDAGEIFIAARPYVIKRRPLVQ